MKISKKPAGVYAANCYVITDDSNSSSVILDPGGDFFELEKFVEDEAKEVKYILLTHGHADHTGAVGKMVLKYKVPLLVHKDDFLLMEKHEYMFGNILEEGVKKEDIKFIDEGHIIEFGENKLKCLHTPGHTPGGLCFLGSNEVFTGDTLFLTSIGRTDFPGGDYNAIIKSIKDELMVLDDSIEVLPGHGPKSSIGYERLNNPFL